MMETWKTRSYGEMASPIPMFHWCTLPVVIVGARRGIGTTLCGGSEAEQRERTEPHSRRGHARRAAPIAASSGAVSVQTVVARALAEERTHEAHFHVNVALTDLDTDSGCVAARWLCVL